VEVNELPVQVAAGTATRTAAEEGVDHDPGDAEPRGQRHLSTSEWMAGCRYCPLGYCRETAK
jgi:hypothetical protein